MQSRNDIGYVVQPGRIEPRQSVSVTIWNTRSAGRYVRISAQEPQRVGSLETVPSGNLLFRGRNQSALIFLRSDQERSGLCRNDTGCPAGDGLFSQDQTVLQIISLDHRHGIPTHPEGPLPMATAHKATRCHRDWHRYDGDGQRLRQKAA